MRPDVAGNFEATARIHNAENETRTGGFTLTFIYNGNVAGTAQGTASDVEGGATATVTFFSLDPFVAGPLTFDFQNDF